MYLKGSARANYNASSNKLRSVELMFDTGAVISQLSSAFPHFTSQAALEEFQHTTQNMSLLTEADAEAFIWRRSLVAGLWSLSPADVKRARFECRESRGVRKKTRALGEVQAASETTRAKERVMDKRASKEKMKVTRRTGCTISTART